MVAEISVCFFFLIFGKNSSRILPYFGYQTHIFLWLQVDIY